MTSREDYVLSVHDNTSDKEIKFKQWNFPAGEVGVKIEDEIFYDHKYSVFLNSARSDDIIACLQLLDVLVEKTSEDSITLGIGYLPYGRQDRVCHEGESFALGLFVKMIAATGVKFVIVADPHSDVFPKLLRQERIKGFVLGQSFCARDLPKFDVLISPDAGATNKARTHRQVSTETEENPTKLVQLSKVRKQGRVEYEDLEFDTIEGNVCVVDDIGDGMTTFLSLGEMLTRTQPNITSLNLYLSHALFSNPEKFEKIKEMYDKIYVYNLMNEKYMNDGQVVQL